MTLATTILKELFGLFVDDGSLAIGVLLLVAGLALALQLGLPAIVAGPLLFFACAALVVENVLRSARAKRP